METKKNINIWKSLQKVPAGTMFVPLIIGAVITTICQGIFDFDLWGTLGNPMKDMFSSFREDGRTSYDMGEVKCKLKKNSDGYRFIIEND